MISIHAYTTDIIMAQM